MVAKIKLQIKVFSEITKQENKIKENKRHKQMLYKILIKDNREQVNAIQKNDPAKLNYKSEWIKFTVENLYEWYKHR